MKESLVIKLGIPSIRCDLAEITPGFYPKAPGDLVMADFVEILEQSILVCSRAKKSKYFINPEENEDDVYLTRESVTRHGKPEWHDKYLKVLPAKTRFDITYSKHDVMILANAKAARLVLQADHRMLTKPVKEESSLAYFPVLLIVLNKANGRIEGYRAIPPLPDYNTMLAGIPGILLELIMNLHSKPRCIEVRNPLLHEMLSHVLRETAIKILIVNNLSECDRAFSALQEGI